MLPLSLVFEATEGAERQLSRERQPGCAHALAAQLASSRHLLLAC